MFQCSYYVIVFLKDAYVQQMVRHSYIPNVQQCQMPEASAQLSRQPMPAQPLYYAVPPKRISKIVIRDPKNNKDVTEEILHSSSTANGRTGGSPPVTNPNAQTDSSKIQAQFAAQVVAGTVAAHVGGEKGKQSNEKKQRKLKRIRTPKVQSRQPK